ncbi:MAG: guanylate kinase [Alphaproteobacteria bacterium]|jgi:guanylate kinase|nr:guanylate kinase [Alphaproteobacteria bacterium]MBT5860604.1 guanylate kinase [Alphaproteobacteria bacterium]
MPLSVRRGLMLVLSSPSGAGKTTLARRLLETEKHLELSVSVTTRPRRSAEVDGRDYKFIDQLTFESMITGEQLLESAEVFGNSYGTPAAPVEKSLADGRDVLFDIDWQGARQLKRSSGVDVVGVFILPPSLEELERRLKTRAQDSDAVVAKRMAAAVTEMSHLDEYDYVLVNQDLEESLAKLQTILWAERMRRERHPGLGKFIETLTPKG